MFKLQQIKETIPSINVQSFAAKFHKLPVKRRDSEPTGNMNSLQIKWPHRFHWWVQKKSVSIWIPCKSI